MTSTALKAWGWGVRLRYRTHGNFPIDQVHRSPWAKCLGDRTGLKGTQTRVVQDSRGQSLCPEFPGKKTSKPRRKTWIRPFLYQRSSISAKGTVPILPIPSEDSLAKTFLDSRNTEIYKELSSPMTSMEGNVVGTYRAQRRTPLHPKQAQV